MLACNNFHFVAFEVVRAGAEPRVMDPLEKMEYNFGCLG